MFGTYLSSALSIYMYLCLVPMVCFITVHTTLYLNIHDHILLSLSVLILLSINNSFILKQLPDCGLSDGLTYEREFRMLIRDGFQPKKGGAPLSTEHVISEDDVSLFVYVFNVQADSEKGAIVDYGSFLDCMKLYHTGKINRHYI